MSWQATTWAMSQKVGNAGRKLLLLALANYADENGVCWPSQGRLSLDTEASLDTIQRQTKKLAADGFVSIERPPKRRGQWQTFIYRLKMPAQKARPQNAVRSESSDDATNSPIDDPAEGCQPVGTPVPKAARLGRISNPPGRTAMPQGAREPGRIAVRPNPSIENSIEPSTERSIEYSRAKTRSGSLARREVWRGKQAVEVIQDRIARRLGPEGWSIIVEFSADELNRLTELERLNRLDDETLQHAALQHTLRVRGAHAT